MANIPKPSEEPAAPASTSEEMANVAKASFESVTPAVPTAADSHVNPPKRPMPAFLTKMMKANQNIICTAKGNDVRKVSISYLLSQKLKIPIFQRRYCWGQDQWDTLFNDVLYVANGKKEKHSLGRITCVKTLDESDKVQGHNGKREGDDGNQHDGRLLVIDGQQRNTTCTLLLAAIRDVAFNLQKTTNRDDNDAATCGSQLVAELDAVLFPDAGGLSMWLESDRSGASTGGVSLREGVSLEFAALIPTYCDRASYFAAVLPPQRKVAAHSAEWQRPWEAKSHFIRKLQAMQGLGMATLNSLADVVLHKLEWLFFPISVNGVFEDDGTEDLQLIFERLAIRDATFCKPSRATEFASMGAADFVRNLLLGSFRCESDAIKMYKDHWLPIEKAAGAAATRNRSSNIAEVLENTLDAFLKAQPEKLVADERSQSMLTMAGAIGGELYPRFRKWLTAALAAEDTAVSAAAGLVPLDEDAHATLERRTALLLQRWRNFAIEHLAENHVSSSISNKATSVFKVPASAKWRCSRCFFPNDARCTQCTACSLSRS